MVANTTPTRKTPITHYASYLIAGEEVHGIATLVMGGYTFRPDDSREVRLVSYKDGDLLLYGQCAIADAQALVDGDKVYTCSQTLTARAA